MWTLTLIQLAQVASLWTGRPVWVRRGLCEVFSLQYPQDMKPAEGEVLLKSALRAHGYQLTERGRGLAIDRGPESRVSVPCRPEFPNLRSKLVRAREGQLDVARQATEVFLSKMGTVDLIPESNALVVTDHAEAIREIEGWIGN